MKNGVPKVYHRFLHRVSLEENTSSTLLVGSNEWYQWLEHHSRFAFVARSGTFTALKQRRAGGWYWYAYQHRNGERPTLALGKSEQLTLEKLRATARTFGSPVLSALRDVPRAGSEWSLEQAREETLLLTKLHIPPLPPHFVPRPSLHEHLSTVMGQRLVLLSAPAGFGKTVLLSSWAAHCPWAVAWVSFNGNDNDPVRFWGYIITALERIRADLGTHALALLRSQQTVPDEAVITALINALLALSTDFILILDDYHLIENAAI